MKEIKDRADIEFLVNQFYTEVLKDEVIGFIFTDVAKISMETHMPIMHDFWETILLGNQAYKGNPMVKHFDLNQKTKLLPAHFKRWKELWIKTVNLHFKGDKAEEAIQRATTIAYLMETKIGEINS